MSWKESNLNKKADPTETQSQPASSTEHSHLEDGHNYTQMISAYRQVLGRLPKSPADMIWFHDKLHKGGFAHEPSLGATTPHDH